MMCGTLGLDGFRISTLRDIERHATPRDKILAGLSGQVLEPTTIYCDNQSCVKLSKNPVFHDRSKHIEIRYHFIIDRVQKGVVKLQYISTDEQIANILTKPLVKGKFVYFKDKLGVVENTSLAKREC
jgi:hypothetical protein